MHAYNSWISRRSKEHNKHREFSHNLESAVRQATANGVSEGEIKCAKIVGCIKAAMEEGCDGVVKSLGKELKKL